MSVAFDLQPFSDADLVDDVETLTPEPVETPEQEPGVIPLSQFVADFGPSLLEAVSRQNPPVYLAENASPFRDAVLNGLRRKPFDAQRDRVQALARLLEDEGEKAAILNAEMGTGKTMMAICLAAVLNAEGYRRTLVISPPHLVYKWRREIMETVPGARVWVLNGPDTLRKLLQLRAMLAHMPAAEGPEFFVLGRVRMRMGFHWRPACLVRQIHQREKLVSNDEFNTQTVVTSRSCAACPHCYQLVRDSEGGVVSLEAMKASEKRLSCKECGEPLWTLMRPESQSKGRRDMVRNALCQLPTIGTKTAERLLSMFGESLLGGMLEDNVYEFINLMDEGGNLVFSDRQAQRMERAMAKTEFSFGQGGYQATEFVKRYLPQHFFDLLVVDEGHEFKNADSAQGQAMGVLANKARKTLLLTGTLMGGYADDLFYLLWRIMPERMIEDGFRYGQSGTLGAASMAFMRRHGVLKDVYKETEGGSHKTARGKRITVRTSKAPGFGPKGIARYVLPFTVFLKLKELGQNVLPPYREHYRDVPMTPEMAERYRNLSHTLKEELKRALVCGDTTLLGVVLNVLLAWPECCFREEVVKHPRTCALLAYVPPVLDETEPSPKEAELIEICRQEKAKGRRVLVYTIYTGKRDTSSRLATLLKAEGFKPAVLRASVDTSQREDWIADQVDRGADVLITNPELVKTGLDLLEFPTIVFMQSGYNVYTVMQAARRSWRIGQREAVDVYYLGYAGSAQTTCYSLMAKKIAVTQSTSGDTPDTGLDVLNQDGDSIEVALAKQLV